MVRYSKIYTFTLLTVSELLTILRTMKEPLSPSAYFSIVTDLERTDHWIDLNINIDDEDDEDDDDDDDGVFTCIFVTYIGLFIRIHVAVSKHGGIVIDPS